MFARLGRWVTGHPFLVLLAWAAVVVLSVPLAGRAPGALVANNSSASDSEARRVGEILERSFGQDLSDRTVVVSEGLPATDPRFREAYDRLVERLGRLEGVLSLTRFDAPSPLKLHSDDYRVTATVLQTRLDDPGPVLAAIRAEVRALELPGTRFYVTGATAITEDFLHLLEQDIRRSEFVALPMVAVVLVLAFGAFVAAGVPLVVGLISITTSMAMLYGLTQLTEVSSFAQSVITMLGLGAGIDYALIMVNRFREELARGRPPREAAALTTRTAGRAVAFSGLTVAVAMASLFIPDLTFIRSMGLGGVLAIFLTVLASVTAVPALLALLGERVNWPRRFALGATSSGQTLPLFRRWAEAVMRRPGFFTLGITAAMLLLAWPLFGMRLGYTGAFGLSPGVESRKGLELIRALELGGSLDTFEVLLDLGEAGFTPEARRDWARLERSLSALPEVRLVISPFLAGRVALGDTASGLSDLLSLTRRSISQDQRYLRLSVVPKQPVRAPEIPAWADKLRRHAKDAGFQTVLLGGGPIGAMEFNDVLIQATPLAILVVFAATFVLLTVAFRSLLIPLKSILMNTLTVGATYGVVTLIFQEGHLGGLFNVDPETASIDPSLPLTMFAVLFGLSMDYEIFLLSRVQEYHLQGLPTREAVKAALERTAGVITSAAAIMIIVFSAFVSGDLVVNKTIGFGLALAVFLDATLIRLMLVPAVMLLAGKWNWWLPDGLRRLLPKVSLERH
ncbi:Heme uptake protein MmpL11 [Calidithermus terrae]|uniref:Heme uptake protein MmpL11 n=1 Tax=Calidithermus terrae TaxID=1408545 RepID=A0A399E900_9DEIN|nr:MMPL family transporter [Calidithermus terrae]RIH81197.1 Heme uptake protein MmpL11 [Calidithermus terrae]